jgi:hypothetical protein
MRADDLVVVREADEFAVAGNFMPMRSAAECARCEGGGDVARVGEVEPARSISRHNSTEPAMFFVLVRFARRLQRPMDEDHFIAIGNIADGADSRPERAGVLRPVELGNLAGGDFDFRDEPRIDDPLRLAGVEDEKAVVRREIVVVVESVVVFRSPRDLTFLRTSL